MKVLNIITFITLYLKIFITNKKRNIHSKAIFLKLKIMFFKKTDVLKVVYRENGD